MGKLFTKMRSAPKRMSALFAMFAVMAIVPAAVLAWGPNRPTHTVEKPADHITFNSITNNPDYGDERNFVRIKDAANTAAGGWSDEINVQPGKEYLVQMYVHNNAASSLNLTAVNTTVKANVPNTTGKKVQIDGFISADNASPKQVWDQAIFNSDKDFNVAYVAGSATYYNNVFPTGTKLADSIVTSAGSKVGYNAMDGKVPGCFQYSGYVSFKVKPQFSQTADFTVNKMVSKKGANAWTDNYQAKPGETVDYLVEYANKGDVQHDNVTVRDTLPAGVSYVNDSTVLGNALHPNGIKTNNGVTTTGLNVGSYKKGGNAWVIFSAKIADSKNLECGKKTLVNKASVETDYGTKDDTANVIVDNGECKPKECKPGIPVGDKRCEEEKCPIPGKQHLPKDSPLCKEDVEKCPIPGKENLPKDSPLCKEDKENCPVPGKETLPKDSPECKEDKDNCPIPGKENLPADSEECVETPEVPEVPETPVTPETPSELPTTGPAEAFLSVIGLGSLIASASYYVVSRRALLGR